MKKLTSLILFVGVLLTSCKKDEPILGTVTLAPSTATLTYSETTNLVPSFSPIGIAKDKTYTWKTSNDTTASVTTVLGGNGLVTAKRIGTATISYVATDGSITATTAITVNPRSNILGNIYYVKGASKTIVTAQETGILNSTESTTLFQVYDRITTSVVKVIRVIYQFDTSNKLVATYAVVDDDTAGANRTSVQQYIEERFEKTATIQHQINFYKADVGPLKMYEANTMIGIFIDNNANTGLPTGLTYSLGVKIANKDSM